MVQPTRQTDSAGNRVDLCDDVAFISENEVRPDYSRQLVADFLAPRKFNKLSRFTGVEVPRDPVWLLALSTELIELVASALKNKEAMPKLFEIREKFLFDRKCVRREQPLFFGKEAFFWKSSANSC